MDGLEIILSEVNQTNTIWFHLYLESEDIDTSDFIYKTEIDSWDRKEISTYKRKQKGKDKLGVWDQHINTTIFKITNKELLYGPGNYIQYLVITYNRKGSEKIHISV